MIHIDKQAFYLGVAAVCAVAGAAFDVKSRRIPNFITLPALAIGLTIHLAVDGWRGLLAAFAAALMCGTVFLLFYLAGGMGAGDVKLMAAVGCLGGPSHCAYLLVLTSLAGGVLGIGLALLRGRLKETLFHMALLAAHHRDEGLMPHPDLNVTNPATLRLPYGLAIAAGCCATFYLHGVGA